MATAACEWLLLHLAHTAALLVTVIVEGEHALCPDQVHALLSIREGVLYPDAIVLLHSIKQLVSLWVQTASIQTAACITCLRFVIVDRSCL